MGGAFSKDSGPWPVLLESFPPKPEFSVDQIPDLTGRVALVTGGNSGIGYETTKVLLQHNAKVYLAARSKERARQAIHSLKEAIGREPIFLELDLADLALIKEAAEEFLKMEHELHILYNNAGLALPPFDLVTKDGYDLQFGTNCVGHWYFTELLMPALLAGVHTSPDHHARVITTSSSGAYFDDAVLDFNLFKDGPARRKASSAVMYYQSKFGNAVVARQIAKRYAEKGIVSIAVNPGNTQSNLQRYAPNIIRTIAKATVLYPTPYGALTQLFAGTMPQALNYNGEYLISMLMVPWARLGKGRPEIYDDELGDRLWRWLEQEVKARLG